MVWAARAAWAVGLPFWIAFVPDQRGQLFSGETLAQAMDAVETLAPNVILLNCAPPADVSVACVSWLAFAAVPLVPTHTSAASIHLSGCSPTSFRRRATWRSREWQQMGARVIGGCCGTTPEHIALLAAEL